MGVRVVSFDIALQLIKSLSTVQVKNAESGDHMRKSVWTIGNQGHLRSSWQARKSAGDGCNQIGKTSFCQSTQLLLCRAGCVEE